jgi:hypothetical protein
LLFQCGTGTPVHSRWFDCLLLPAISMSPCGYWYCLLGLASITRTDRLMYHKEDGGHLVHKGDSCSAAIVVLIFFLWRLLLLSLVEFLCCGLRHSLAAAVGSMWSSKVRSFGGHTGFPAMQATYWYRCLWEKSTPVVHAIVSIGFVVVPVSTGLSVCCCCDGNLRRSVAL